MNIIIAILCFSAGVMFGLSICGILHYSRGNVDETQQCDQQ